MKKSTLMLGILSLVLLCSLVIAFTLIKPHKQMAPRAELKATGHIGTGGHGSFAESK